MTPTNRATGLKIREIAEQLGLKQGTVKTHIKNARVKQELEAKTLTAAPPAEPAHAPPAESAE